MSGFIIRGLDPAPFVPLYGLDDAALAERRVVRMRADARPGFPCRLTLADAEPGEDLLLLNYEHHGVDTPYRSSHAIFVREGAVAAAEYRWCVPEQMACRLLSVRAFDDVGMMTDAEVIDGTMLAELIGTWFADPRVAYLHVHNARRGCFAGRVDRG